MILEHYPENERGLGHADHGRLRRARILRAAGYVVDIETIRVIESPERPGAGPEFGSAPRESRLGGSGSRSQSVVLPEARRTRKEGFGVDLGQRQLAHKPGGEALKVGRSITGLSKRANRKG